MRDAEIDRTLTWTPFRGLPLCHVLGKAKETWRLCPAACLHRTLTLEGHPKWDTWRGLKPCVTPPAFPKVLPW